jgi:hypothetical protein
VKGNTNSVLIYFQKTASILFYINVGYAYVYYNNLCNDNEVIDHTGHERPPSIVQLEDDTLSSLSSNTLSSSSSDTLSSLLSNTSSLLSSNSSSRSLTSVGSKTNLDDDDLLPSSSQLTKNSKSYSKTKMSENQRANYVLSFCDWAMGKMSESCYKNPHQELCEEKIFGAKMSKMLHCAHKGCKVRVHSICQIDWLKRHCLEVNHDDPFFADSTTSVTRMILCKSYNKSYQNYVRLRAR